MRSRRIVGLWLLPVFCFLMASCIDSKNPLCPPKTSKADPALKGVWRMTHDDGQVEYCHVGAASGKFPAGVLRLVLINQDKDGSIERPTEILAFPTSIGKNRYLNVVVTEDEKLDLLTKNGWNPELVHGYFILKYRIQDDVLTLWNMDQDAKRRAIEAGTIQGEIGKKDSTIGQSVCFTDTPEKLTALLTSPEGDKLFNKSPEGLQVYKRIK
ncbi:MAG: hypothetical protein ABFC77_15705 [Thermoguttaceae bacterium]